MTEKVTKAALGSAGHALNLVEGQQSSSLGERSIGQGSACGINVALITIAGSIFPDAPAEVLGAAGVLLQAAFTLIGKATRNLGNEKGLGRFIG